MLRSAGIYLAPEAGRPVIRTPKLCTEANHMEPVRSPQSGSEEWMIAFTVAEMDPSLLEAMLLRRLKRALLLRYYTESLLAPHDRLLLDRVIYSSFCDCQSNGLGPVARRLLGEARSGSGLFRRPSGGTGGGSAWST